MSKPNEAKGVKPTRAARRAAAKRQRLRRQAMKRRGKQTRQTKLATTAYQAAESNDQLAGLLAYDVLRGQHKQTIKRLWWLVGGLTVLSGLSIGLAIYLATQRPFYPVLVKVNGNNQILDVERASRLNPATLAPEMHTFLLEQFVKQARTVSIDGQLESEQLKSAYALTQGAATTTLANFFRQRQPLVMASTAVISVHINSITPNVGGSAHTTQVIWTETSRDPKTGRVLNHRSYTGAFTFAQATKPPVSPQISRYNPFGFYITHISWSQNFESFDAQVAS